MRRAVKECWSQPLLDSTPPIAADRTALAWQNTAYNQPPHTGFFIGADMPTPPRPAVHTP